MRLMVRHVSRDGLTVKSEVTHEAVNPKEGARKLAHDYYIKEGERVDVLLLRGDEMLNYEVTSSRIDEGGCRVRYVSKSA